MNKYIPNFEINDTKLEEKLNGVNSEDKENVKTTLLIMLTILEKDGLSALKNWEVEIKETYYNLSVFFPPEAILDGDHLALIKDITAETCATEKVWICWVNTGLRLNAKIWKKKSNEIIQIETMVLKIRKIHHKLENKKRPRLLYEPIDD